MISEHVGKWLQEAWKAWKAAEAEATTLEEAGAMEKVISTGIKAKTYTTETEPPDMSHCNKVVELLQVSFR